MKVLFFSNEHPAKRKLASQIANHFNPGDLEIYHTLTSFDATDPIIIKVLQEREITYDEYAIKQSDNISKEKYDLIIVLCKCIRTPFLSYPGFPAVLHWPIENPVKRGLSPLQIQSSFRRLRDELINKITHLIHDGYLESFQKQYSQVYSLFNDQTQAYLKFNRDEFITGFNEQAGFITGYMENDVFGKPLHYLLPDDMVSRHALAVLDEGVVYRKTSLKLKKANGDMIKIMATFKSIPNSSGVGGLISFMEMEEDPVIQPIEGARGLDRLSWDRVEVALKQTAGNRTKASRILGVGRATFYRFLDKEKARGRIPKIDLV